MFLAFLALQLSLQIDHSLLQDLRVQLFQAESPKSVGHLSSEDSQQIRESSFEYRARAYAAEKGNDRLGIGLREGLSAPTLIKSAALLYLLWPKKKVEKPKAECRTNIQKLLKNDYWKKILAAGLGLWIAADARKAYLSSQRDFELEWFQNYEREREFAESWGYDGNRRDLELAARLVDLQTRELRKQISTALAPKYELLWIPKDFQLSDLGKAFVSQTAMAFYSEETDQVLLVRFQFLFSEQSWRVDHSTWISRSEWELHLQNPSKLYQLFVGKLDFASFWFRY